MIDTAASTGLIFTAPFSRDWGLPDAVRSLSERLMPSRGGGVGGPEDNTVGRIESVEIGPFSVARPVVRFAHARGGSLARTDFDALIGMELLPRFRVIFDHSRQRVILEPNANLDQPMEADMSGLSLRSAGPALEHIVVADVHQDTPASAADLRAGDRIISIDGRVPGSLWDAQRALMAGPDRTVRLGIERSGSRLEVTLTLRRFV
jgi:S1-C subfamily serine protease